MTNDDKKIAKIALKLLKKRKWKDLSLLEIKKESKIRSFNQLVKNKNSIIKKINEYFDYELTLASKNIEESNNKDMLFEILMIRFDILQKHRKGIISIFKSFKLEPQNLIFFLPNIIDSIILMIGFTNIPSGGILGQIKIKGVLIIYLSSFLIWMKDETLSLEKTMTNLDKNLDQANKILRFIK